MLGFFLLRRKKSEVKTSCSCCLAGAEGKDRTSSPVISSACILPGEGMNGRELFGSLHLQVTSFHAGVRVDVLSLSLCFSPFAHVESEGTTGSARVSFACLLEAAASVLLNCTKALPNRQH